jgi:GNAT superfamily N-acetyltransferase
MIRPVDYKEVKQFDGRAARNMSHIYEGKTPLSWYGLFIDGILCGCVGLLRITSTKARVRGLFVDESHRRQGFGSSLILYAESEARRLGYTVLEADTAFGSLFQKHGWADTGIKYKTFPGRRWRKIL